MNNPVNPVNLGSDSAPLSPPSTSTAQSYWIAGVKVEFPAKAYPSQLAMMNKVIQGLKRGQDCLLESPTGSGKTLALLCASLAWQRQEAVTVNAHNAKVEQMEADLRRKNAMFLKKNIVITNPSGYKSQFDSTQISNTPGPTQISNTPGFTQQDSGYISGVFSASGSSPPNQDEVWSPGEGAKTGQVPLMELSDDEDFADIHKMREQNILPDQSKVKAEAKPEVPNEQNEPIPKRMSVKKIFFGTRTHKQISQITRELRKSLYQETKIVLLASREHTCVNPVVERSTNRNEACKDLRDQETTTGEGCSWHLNAKKLSNFGSLTQHLPRPIYDLEDLVQAGRVQRACPYYATRNLMDQADLIICPYNYLIDPVVRKSMTINVKDQVIIFDEAHNMEDASRESASFIISQDEVRVGMNDCEALAKTGKKHGDFEGSDRLDELQRFLSQISGWMDSISRSGKMEVIDYTTKCASWNGTDFLALMDNHHFDEKRIMNLERQFRDLLAAKDAEQDARRERGRREPGDREDKPLISTSVIVPIEKILQIFTYLTQESGKWRNDFHIALYANDIRQWGDDKKWTSKSALSLHFWCLNPAVIFQSFKSQVYNIILTSGTLSPMQSFASELGSPFPIKLEANHVIDPSQVWVGALAAGPDNNNLNGTFQNTGKLVYQDELGKVVENVCKEMPHGVLVFFPSYRLMELCRNRWAQTDILYSIGNVKRTFIESRANPTEFQESMDGFYHTIKMTEESYSVPYKPNQELTGALFMAVCRGKVSEGMDFADNNARVVICIGIPYPNLRDKQVEKKRNFNNANKHKGLLSGSEWYDIQAFRALNQALGRCIRHRNDWGAILLVDDRFVKNSNMRNSLSKWVRNSVRNFQAWPQMIESFCEFRNAMLARPKPASAPIPDCTLMNARPVSQTSTYGIRHDEVSNKSSNNDSLNSAGYSGRKYSRASSSSSTVVSPSSTQGTLDGFIRFLPRDVNQQPQQQQAQVLLQKTRGMSTPSKRRFSHEEEREEKKEEGGGVDENMEVDKVVEPPLSPEIRSKRRGHIFL